MTDPLTLTHPELDRGRLQVRFQWHEDRFAQRISGTAADGRAALAWEAVNPLDTTQREVAWPPSPPIQELSRETIGDRELLLGVGRAGTAHWSVSIETLVIDGRAVLFFDWACRSSQPAGWLGCSYRAEPAGQSGLVESLDIVPLIVICHDDTDCQTDTTGGWQIAPKQLPDSWPATVRWRYGIGLG